MKRIERKLFEIGDEINRLQHAVELAKEELVYHEHLNDDAQRDAAVSGSPIDRSDARETASDVSRFERHLAELQGKTEKLEAKRQKFLNRLAN